MSEEEQYQLELECYFRKLSADRWAAGWLTELEFFTWEEMLGIGSGSFEDYELNHLCELSRYAGGWFYYNMEKGATFISMPAWLDKYREWKSAR